MSSPFVSQQEGARTLPVGFDQIEPGVLAEIVAAVVRTDRQPWRFDFRTGTLDPADWTSSVGPGMTADASTGNLIIAAGTTASSTTLVRSTRTFRAPVRALATITLSQRIANQEFYFELVNAAGDVFSRFKFDGTVNTAGKVENAVGALASNQSLNSAITTSATSGARLYEIDLAIDEINYRDRGLNSSAVATGRAQRNTAIPHPDDDLYLQFRVVNLGTAPASNTNMQIDFGFVQDEHQLATEVVGGRGIADAGVASPVQLVGGSSALTASSSRIGFVAASGMWIDTTTTPLAAAGTYTGAGRDLTLTGSAVTFGSTASYFEEYRALAISDVAGTLYLEVSRDNFTTARRILAVPATNTNTGGLYTAEIRWYPSQRYSRVVYVNGAGAQTHFTLSEALIGA